MKKIAGKFSILMAVMLLMASASFAVASGVIIPPDTPLFSVEKKVWDEDAGEWVDHLYLRIDEGSHPSLRFKCTIAFNYIPEKNSGAYDISLKAFDYLPGNLRYVPGSSNYPAIYWENNNTIYWPDLLPLHGSIVGIYFNATVVDEGTTINNFTAYFHYESFDPIPIPGGFASLPSSSDSSISYSDYDTAEIDIEYIHYHTLEVSVDPEGAGSVELDPAGGTYEEGTSVELTAVASEG
ncbi:MAG: hypothetical protein J7K13_00870, partial [Thermoplasmata archaeon]|nr:hypothetical protein [Thermoplasmata archaeon]